MPNKRPEDRQHVQTTKGHQSLSAMTTTTGVVDFKSPGFPYGALKLEPVPALVKKVVGMEGEGSGPCVEGFRLSFDIVDVIVIGDTYFAMAGHDPHFCLFWRHKYGPGPSEWTCFSSSPELDGTPLDWVRKFPLLLPLFGPELWLEIPLEDVVAWGETANHDGCSFDMVSRGGPLAIERRATNNPKGTARFYVYRRETGHDVAYFHVVEGELYYGIHHDAWEALTWRLPNSAKIIFAPTATPTPLRVSEIRDSPNGIEVKAGVKIEEYHP